MYMKKSDKEHWPLLSTDLFSGSGWAVACQRLGIDELGVEIMPEAIATRNAMGLATLHRSVAELPDEFCSQAPLQIASPPCQTFSVAGKGAGRAALNEVLRRLHVLARTGVLDRNGGDSRTWLVLEPLRLALHGRPRFLLWEQVPTVQPVWNAAAAALKEAGYSVVTGRINAEQYGVPQTRKRSILIGRLDGIPASFPVPTHSRYYSQDPSRLDSGVLPWVSMAEALGWGMPGRPSFTVCGGGVETGGAEPFGHAARESMLVYRNGNQANAAERESDKPAPTIHFGNASNSVTWIQRSNYTGNGSQTTPSPVPGSPPLGMRHCHQPSVTITQKAPHWADPEIPSNSIRVSETEAAVLQTFPADHPFQGKSGKRYLQIGNAVPPLLAYHLLKGFLP